MKAGTRENLERLITRIDAMRAGMQAGLGERPDCFGSAAERIAYEAWDKRRTAAVDHIMQTLADEENARFRRSGAHDCFITLAGVSSSCTSGWENLLRNWQGAARRRIEREKAA